ncbi:hypothetical protein OPT61_g5499 [Boeremia exigua]|uniref:Uncharacterized protein n=1 Tax=Boeremia exigua TaxID=749465 RepID=A0ACC2IA36_9PLEO|nr:hypothetical protein OPT61_g5499 [Boeremia exigua]
MARGGVFEILETLGFKHHSTSVTRRRAIFHYEPLLRLYHIEIPSLFGLLLRDEGIFLDRADPTLFQIELEQMLTELGPLIWPSHGRGRRDHLLQSTEGSRYTSDLVYPRDKDMLVLHLRNLILSKQARPGTDVDALIEKRHKNSKIKIFRKAGPDRAKSLKGETREETRSEKAGDDLGEHRQTILADVDSEPFDAMEATSSDSDAPLINHHVRRRARIKAASQRFQVALRLYRPTASDESQRGKSCHSYRTILLDNKNETVGECFARVRRHINRDCTYIEFHPPEDMSLEGRIRIDCDSLEADNTFGRVMSMFREARRFPGEPSYRTVEVEIGFGTLPVQ